MWFCHDFRICRPMPSLELKLGRHLSLRARPPPRPPLSSVGYGLSLFASIFSGPRPGWGGKACPTVSQALRVSAVEEFVEKCKERETLVDERQGAHSN